MKDLLGSVRGERTPPRIVGPRLVGHRLPSASSSPASLPLSPTITHLALSHGIHKDRPAHQPHGKHPHRAPGISRTPPARSPIPISEGPNAQCPLARAASQHPACPSADIHQTWSRPRELLVHQEIRTGTHQGFLGMAGTSWDEAQEHTNPWNLQTLLPGKWHLQVHPRCLAMKSGHSSTAS